ncbi:MAG TPA: hypothetical protein VKX49_22665 [Bryobacteraceae bacterium]|nr:hypothetical protein [Bryobacteraceae bacterium]
MRFTGRAAAAAALLFGSLPLWAADPLVGTWRLDQQEVNGQPTQTDPMVLRITEAAGGKLSFAFSVPVNNIYFVSMSYVVKLDGTESGVKNGHGETVGAIRITSAAPYHYKLLLKAPNRPDSNGTLTVSPSGKTLTSETESTLGGRTMHSKQTFSRQ